MKKLLLIALLIVGCDKKLSINTTKETYNDSIADITYFNDSFFTTNYDLSSNANSQINLLKFAVGNPTIYIEDSYDLNLNGQKYLSITNNGLNIFLQSRESYLLLKYSSIGELIYTTMDTIDTNWQPSGITYNNANDSIIVLYRNLDSLSQYKARSTSSHLTFLNSNDIIFNLDFIDTTYYGIYALDYKNNNYFMLGLDTTKNDIIVITNNMFQVTAIDTISDSTVVGLSFRGDDLFLSYRNRRIEYWKNYSN